MQIEQHNESIGFAVTLNILPTKLFIPRPQSNLVPRQHLLERLDSGLDGKLTLVSAPAGYGKSTLLAAWAQQAKIPIAWLSIDGDDNDPIRFWTHFIAALRSVPLPDNSRVGEGFLQLQQNPVSSEYEPSYRELIAEIIALGSRFVIILDDFHTLIDPQVLDMVFYLLENIPTGFPSLHLIFSCRNDPPWPLARLRVRKEINEIRAKDLRFTRREAAAFLTDVMELPLSQNHVREIDRRTEGWAAGLQMAAISLQGRNDISEFLRGFSGSHRFVLDYLVEEVLDRQSETDLDFLLKTSLLERLTGSLCDAVVERQGSSEILQRLEKSNMFLVALDDQRVWYRYHHLFSDLLQKQLLTREPEAALELHRRASQWYAQADYPRETIAHALKTNDWVFAADQVERHVLEFIQRGSITLVRQWLRSLPQEVIWRRPILCIAQALTSAKYATADLAAELLTKAEAALERGNAEDGGFDKETYDFISTQIAVAQVVIARARGDSTQRQQELALAALEQIQPAQDPASRATLFLRLGFCYLDQGEDRQAAGAFSQAFKLGQTSGNHYAAHGASYGQMVIDRRHGRLQTLDARCRQAFNSIPKGDERLQSLSGIALTMQGMLYYEWNNLAEAARALTQGLEMLEHVSMTELLIKGKFTVACLSILKGSQAPIPDLSGIAEKGSPALISFAAALRARLYLFAHQNGAQHDPLEPFQWASNQQFRLRGQPTYDWEIIEKLVYARVLIKQYLDQPTNGRKTALTHALAFLEDQVETLADLNWEGILIEVHVVMAVLLHSLGKSGKALTALEQALSFGESQRFVRTFIDEGSVMREMLQIAARREICEGYTHILLSSYDSQLKPFENSKQIRGSALIDPLTKRETQILHCLKTQLSVPEIADEIHLAPTTVRTHVQNIYRKLGVKRRMEAIQKAGKIGLL